MNQRQHDIRMIVALTARAEAAEAHSAALEEALRDGFDCVEAYHGPPDDEEGCAVCIWMRRVAALAPAPAEETT